ncbi:hypothetical protein Bca4012_064546 [Brassica carinata]|uniref:Uncharacterized protein n=1 Tax=Brassica carinata TaxID=52824 RepID=A0A8X8AX01_BRACI|nr:hypothetical protein Bca52824_017035 [Brassica carinata]
MPQRYSGEGLNIPADTFKGGDDNTGNGIRGAVYRDTSEGLQRGAHVKNGGPITHVMMEGNPGTAPEPTENPVHDG